MKNRISTGKSLLQTVDRNLLQQCMHCGMCLPTCPTYVETKMERHSPRGRIALIKAIADGELELSRAFGEEMYYCLGCLACTTACPAGVDYPSLFESARAEIERVGVLRNPKRNFIRWALVKTLFTRPRLLRLFGRCLYLWQASSAQSLFRKFKLVRLLPRDLRELEPQTPEIKRYFSNQLIHKVEKPEGIIKGKVALLTGCVQDLAFSNINRATVDVLLENGYEVYTPPVQPCCGSLHAHNGELELARKLARKLIDLIDPTDFDAIISNAGGCGSHLMHFDSLLQNDVCYSETAKLWCQKYKDIHRFPRKYQFSEAGEKRRSDNKNCDLS